MATEKPTVDTIERQASGDRDITAAPGTIENHADLEEGDLKKPVDLEPKPEDQLEALGIPNWQDVERQVVKRLDMTLMPCLWCLYLFSMSSLCPSTMFRVTVTDVQTTWTERPSRRLVCPAWKRTSVWRVPIASTLPSLSCLTGTSPTQALARHSTGRWR
jgi:hypothetical protein